jgi:peptidoglycan L-alanyl-D-glutamate endopeptidase CwlK
VSNFRLSYASMQKLDGVHHDLKLVVINALDFSPVDFKVLEGLRLPSRQAQLLRAGASQTMNSRHLPNQKGICHAVDLGALLDGEIRWDWGLYYQVAAAVRRASAELKIPVRWGGVWDRALADLGETADDMEDAVADYVSRRRALKRKAFIDGPHFELPELVYP